MKEKCNLIGSSKPAVLLRCHSYVGPHVTKTAFFFSIYTKKNCAYYLLPLQREIHFKINGKSQFRLLYKKKIQPCKIQFSWINEFPDPVYLHAAQMPAPKPAVALTRTMRFWRHLVEHNSCASSTRSTLAVLRRLATSQVASLRWPIGCQSAARARPITIKDFGTNLNRE